MPLAPLAFGVVAFLGLLTPGRSIRESALLALTAVMVALVLITEALSVFSAITPYGLFLAWLAALALAIVWARRRLLSGLARLRSAWKAPCDRSDLAAACVLAAFGAGTLASALLYPVVNYDSLTAHLPRVFFWLQQGSVEHFPTPFGPQLFSGATTAYVVLHLKALAGDSDRLVNLAGWLAYVFSVLTVTLIAERLGASGRGQRVAALAAAATPMAVLQASTTQTDLTTALWCLAAVYGVLRFVRPRPADNPPGAGWAAATGAALGLALGAKASAYLVLAAFFAWLLADALKRTGVARAVTLGAIVLSCALALNAGVFARNAETLGGDVIPTGAPGMSHILAWDLTPGALATNALKNISMTLGTPSETINSAIAGAADGIVGSLGGDVDSGVNVEVASGAYRLDGRVTNHDVGPAPVTALLLTLSVAIVLGVRPAGRRLLLPYLGCAAAALLMIAALVNWNLFINRILLPPLLLTAPIAGVAYEHLGTRRVTRAALLLLLALAVGWGALVMAFNSTNRLVPPGPLAEALGTRDLGWWNTRYDDLRFRVLAPEMEKPSLAVAEAIESAGATRVGILDRVRHAPVYCLLLTLEGRQVAYTGDTLFPDRPDPAGFSPEVIIEILPGEDYPAALLDGTPRGAMLLEPQLAGTYYVILLYRMPNGGCP